MCAPRQPQAPLLASFLIAPPHAASTSILLAADSRRPSRSQLCDVAGVSRKCALDTATKTAKPLVAEFRVRLDGRQDAPCQSAYRGLGSVALIVKLTRGGSAKPKSSEAKVRFGL